MLRIVLLLSIALGTAPAMADGLRLPTIAPAQDGPLRALQTTDEVRPYTAIGRLDTGGGFCTATLVAADLVLTAAHCLFESDGTPLEPERTFTFNAGLRNGHIDAGRRISGHYIHPDYDYGSPDDLDRVRTDLAILRLDRPIVTSAIRPMEIAGQARRGDAVEIVSYGREREEFASREAGCEVLESDPGVHVLSCSVVPGSSGSPVMVRDPDGLRIVSVVSASAHWRDQQVALAAATAPEIARVMALSRATPPAFTASGLPGSRLPGNGGGGRDGSTARFIRP
ncbi:trypsin-like serine protease [Rhodobacterales bacterium HKCCE3408]|nr:trypsin-like serine protease [Rhodobacterales bacterium HKCCE3408]